MKNTEINFTQEQAEQVEQIIKEVTEKKEVINPYTVTKYIPAREKMNFFKDCAETENKKDIFPIVKDFAKKVFPVLPEHIRTELKKNPELWKKVALNLYACGIARYEMEQVETWKEYMIKYATFKANTYIRLNDLGAFADVVETSLHLLVCREEWKVKIKNLHVSAIGKTDITLNGRKTEVGTNGKSWNDSRKNDPMHGPFQAVIYGVFTEEEKEQITSLFVSGEVKKALTNIADMTYYFFEKEDFCHLMNYEVSKTPGIIWKKAGYYQTVYNGSKHSAFLRMVEKQNINSVHEVLGFNTLID